MAILRCPWNILLQAGLHIRDGLDEHEALKSITTHPAEVLGLAHQIGLTKDRSQC